MKCFCLGNSLERAQTQKWHCAVLSAGSRQKDVNTPICSISVFIHTPRITLQCLEPHQSHARTHTHTHTTISSTLQTRHIYTGFLGYDASTDIVIRFPKTWAAKNMQRIPDSVSAFSLTCFIVCSWLRNSCSFFSREWVHGACHTSGLDGGFQRNAFHNNCSLMSRSGTGSCLWN